VTDPVREETSEAAVHIDHYGTMVAHELPEGPGIHGTDPRHGSAGIKIFDQGGIRFVRSDKEKSLLFQIFVDLETEFVCYCVQLQGNGEKTADQVLLIFG